jgi:hypothetical protein
VAQRGEPFFAAGDKIGRFGFGERDVAFLCEFIVTAKDALAANPKVLLGKAQT